MYTPINTLTPEQVAKLVKYLGMLGSDFDGEVVAAARAANALIRSEGFTWEEVLAPLAEHVLVRASTRASYSPGMFDKPLIWQDFAEACLDNADILNEWEIGFVNSIALQIGKLTEKQAAKLASIMQKCGILAE